jgi:hypothetical protein
MFNMARLGMPRHHKIFKDFAADEFPVTTGA